MERLAHIFLRIGTGLALLVLACTAMAPSAQALSGSQFHAERIMDDSVFFSSGTMSMDEIQHFLEAKVPNCDTNGSQQHSSGMSRAAYGASRGYPAPYTCLRDFRQDVPARSGDSMCAGISAGNKSGAQIIFEVAHICGVNPKVLIVLLQKEQSLITDDWPWSIQYRSATGYGCPDTAPCDAEYYGFFNQVYAAAKQFKRYAQIPTSFNYRSGRTSYVGYNPNGGCSGSNIGIQNQATAGLYNYTPYQPNQAALNNLYGSGDGCSAYGNRNFWRMFNDWFGPTTGPLVRSPESAELYYSDGGSKYRVGSMDMAGMYGLGVQDVRIIPQSELDSLPLASSPNTPNLSYVAKSNSDSDSDGGALYLVSMGRRYHITSMDVFDDYGFTLGQIGYMPLVQLERMPLAGNLSNFAQANDGFIYEVTDGVRHGIFDYNTYTQQNPSGNLSRASDYVLATIPLGQAIINDKVVMKDPEGRVWLADSNGWFYVSSMEQYTCLGLSGLANIPFNYGQAPVGTQAGNASCVVQTSGGQKFIMDAYRRLPVDSSWGFASFASLGDNFIQRMSVQSPTQQPVFRSSDGAPLYVLEGGKKRQIYSLTTLNITGHSLGDIFTGSSNFLANIPDGAPKLDGMVFGDVSNGRLYVLSGTTKYYVPSMFILASYGFSPASIVMTNSSTLSSYTNGATLQQKAKASGSTIFDSGIALQLSASVEAHYGIDGSTPTFPSAVAVGGSPRQGTRYTKFGSSPQLYYMENGQKRPVYSWDTFTSLGGSVNNITGLSDSAADLFPTGSPM